MSDYRPSNHIDELFGELSETDIEKLAQASTSLDVARIVYQARTIRGLTQSEAARQSGLKQQAVSRMEGGVLNVTVGTLERFLRHLGYAIELRLVDDRTGEVVESLVLNDSRERSTSREPAYSNP